MALTAYAGISSVIGYGLARQNYRAVKKASDYTERFYNGYRRENFRYWQDYIKSHHLQNRVYRYPYRTGYYYNLSSVYSARARQVSARNSMYSAGVRMFSPLGLYQRGTAYGFRPMNASYMYG